MQIQHRDSPKIRQLLDTKMFLISSIFVYLGNTDSNVVYLGNTDSNVEFTSKGCMLRVS